MERFIAGADDPNPAAAFESVTSVGDSQRSAILVHTSSVDDYAVAVALAIADDTFDVWRPVLTSVDGAAGVDVDDAILTGDLFAVARWSFFQRLWYRWRAPHDVVAPMRWYLAAHAAAGGQVDVAADVDRWLGHLDACPPSQRPGWVRELIGADASVPLVVGCGEAIAGLPAMAFAAASGRPFVWCESQARMLEAAAAERNAPTVWHASEPTAAASARAALAQRGAARCLARSSRLHPTPDEIAARETWSALPADERAERLAYLGDRYAILGPVRVEVLGTALDNQSGVAVAAACLEAPPAQWSPVQLAFVTSLWLWDISDISFTELNRAELSLSMLADFLTAKRARYCGLLGRASDDPPGSLFDLARDVAELRRRVERDNVRCFAIDGGTWERREHFVPIARVDADAVPPEYEAAIAATVGVALPPGDDYRTRFTRLVEELDRRAINPVEVLIVTAHHLLRDPQLRPDYVVVTAARGVCLLEPWSLKLHDVFSYTAVRDGFAPGLRDVRLSTDKVRSAISQRMRYNVTCRGRNYSPVREERLRAQPFQFPDVAHAEDAHHGGHRATGIRLVARAPFELDVAPDRRWRGLGDVRINRVSHGQDDRFGFDELPAVIRVSWWCRAIVEAAYARGLHLDEEYCGNAVVDPEWLPAMGSA